jgi:methyl acetate hydrolase
MTDTRSSRREVLKAASVIAAAAPVVRLAGAPTTARAATPAAGQKAALATIDAAFRAAVDAKKVAGVVAIAATDKGVIYEGAIGRRDMDKGPDMTPDTLFWIASMTKAVTGTACMQLVEQGKLKLDDPVGELLPDLAKPQILEGFDTSGQPKLRPATKPITLRHLMTHTAGFVYSIWSEPMLQYEKVTGSPFVGSCKTASLRAPLMFEPGERWEYGINTAWLGQVVEAVSGLTLDAYLREHLFTPLGMVDATFSPSAAQRGRLMDIHDRTPDGGLAPSEIDLPDAPELAFGGEGAFATARDYMRFLRCLLNGGELDGARILQPDSVNLMFTDHLGGAALPEIMRSAIPELTNDVPAMPFRQGWGLGLHLTLEDLPGMRHAGSGDWAGLFNSYYWVDRTSGIAAAIFTQLLPFFDARMVGTLLEFEQAVYAQVGAPAVA